MTPFLLARISELTGGESLKLNQQLIEHNALVGAQIALEYSRLSREASSPPRPPSAPATPPNPSSSGYYSFSEDTHQRAISTNANHSSQSDPSTTAHRSSSASIPVSHFAEFHSLDYRLVTQFVSRLQCFHLFKVVIGGSIYDIVTKAHSDSVKVRVPWLASNKLLAVVH